MKILLYIALIKNNSTSISYTEPYCSQLGGTPVLKREPYFNHERAKCVDRKQLIIFPKFVLNQHFRFWALTLLIKY